MRSELKIGILVGIVLVVGIVIFVVKNSGDNNRADNPTGNNPDTSKSQANKSTRTNPPAPVNPTPTTPTNPTPTNPLPNNPDEVEVVNNQNDNDTPTNPPDENKTIIPLVNESKPPIEPVIVEPIIEKKEPRYHVVKAGENLYTISELYYGQGNQTVGTKAIQQANPDKIKDINTIHPGWRLRIPYPEDIAP
jgi:nucleoid-associated protein YgaU